MLRTSRGLGALIAEKFAAEGCNVAVNYNASKDRAEHIAIKIAEEYRVKSLVIRGVGLSSFLAVISDPDKIEGHGYIGRLRENGPRGH